MRSANRRRGHQGRTYPLQSPPAPAASDDAPSVGSTPTLRSCALRDGTTPLSMASTFAPRGQLKSGNGVLPSPIPTSCSGRRSKQGCSFPSNQGFISPVRARHFKHHSSPVWCAAALDGGHRLCGWNCPRMGTRLFLASPDAWGLPSTRTNSRNVFRQELWTTSAGPFRGGLLRPSASNKHILVDL